MNNYIEEKEKDACSTQAYARTIFSQMGTRERTKRLQLCNAHHANERKHIQAMKKEKHAPR